MGTIRERLSELGIVIPEAAKPVANYLGWVESAGHVFTAGQLPVVDGRLRHAGKAGREVTVEEAAAAARICAVNAIAQVSAALEGDLERVSRVVKLVGFVNAEADFTEHPQVVNGASDLMVEVFGDIGRHARSAVGVSSLPLNAPVEVEVLFEIRR